MKSKIMTLCLAMMVVLTAEEAQSSEADAVLITASTVALFADYFTTLDMTGRYDEGYYETNPKLGTHPSESRIHAHFLPLIAVHVGGNYLIKYIPSKKWRDFARWTGNTAVFFTHGPAALNNYRIGLRLTYDF